MCPLPSNILVIKFCWPVLSTLGVWLAIGFQVKPIGQKSVHVNIKSGRVYFQFNDDEDRSIISISFVVPLLIF